MKHKSEWKQTTLSLSKHFLSDINADFDNRLLSFPKCSNNTRQSMSLMNHLVSRGDLKANRADARLPA